MSTGIEWTSTRIARLLQLVKTSSLSYAGIASTLSKEFGIPLSRCACLGKINRMKEPVQKAVVTHRPRKPRLPPQTPKPKATHGHWISLFDLQPGDCRWPHGDRSPFLFCAEPALEDKSYCQLHADMARGCR